jgi:predicted enzyme related to lactoylglutathione lyase/uncharacterized protein YndB with AHSA1/START domain
MIPTNSTILNVRRFIPAPRARVFAAFTNPDDYVKWIGPGPNRCLSARLDVRQGGKYSVRMMNPQYGEMEARGEYLEVRTPERLVFTWQWAEDSDWEKTGSTVTIDFIELDGGTDVQLKQEKFPSVQSRDNHAHGWSGSFDNLLAFCAPESKPVGCSPEAKPAIGEFCWNELLTSDVPAAGKFYSGLFGWKETPFQGPVPYTIFRIGEKGVGGMMQQQQPGTPPLWLSYMSVADCDGAVDKAVKLGAKVCMPPKDIPTIGRIAVLTDPQGAPFGLHQPEQA